jgi:hypothetical protein
MKREILFVHEVETQADNCYDDAQQLGQWAAKALGGRRRAQITGLESIANNMLKVSDVLDYLKKQTARSKPGEDWQHRHADGRLLGPALIAFVQDKLKSGRKTVCGNVAKATGQAVTAEEEQKAYLDLIREFIRQVAAQYEYEVGVSRHDS